MSLTEALINFKENKNKENNIFSEEKREDYVDILHEISGKDFWRVKIPEIRWIIPNILRTGLGILIGAQKQGKSTLATDIAFAVASGGKAMKYITVEQGDVLNITYEDNLNDLRTRALAMGYSNNFNFEKITFKFEFPRQDMGGLEQIENWLKSHPHARLIVIDPFVNFRSQRNKSDFGKSAYEIDYAVNRELHELACKYNVAILLVHHESKTKCNDFVMDANGSVGMTAVVNSILSLKRDRGQNIAILRITGRGIKEQEYALSGDGVSWELKGDAEKFSLSEKKRKIIDFLKENGETTPKEIAEIFEIKPNTIKSLLWRMSKEENSNIYNKEGRYGVRNNIE